MFKSLQPGLVSLCLMDFFSMTDIVCISDTHQNHDRISVPDGDILVHAGDFCSSGDLLEVSLFLDWIESQPHKIKIVVPGNHDRCLESNIKAREEFSKVGVHLLIDEEYVDPSSGLKFYGVPWTPDFYPDIWAFQDRDAPENYWAAVPADTDFIVSHGPPLGVADQIYPGVSNHLGSSRFAAILEKFKGYGVICGHIHGGYGEYVLDRYAVVNASSCTEAYLPTNEPIIWTVKS